MRGSLWILVVASLAAAACGSASSSSSTSPSSNATAPASAPPTATPAPPDQCQLVTLQDAESLAGSPLQPGVEGNPSSPSCSYGSKPTDPTAQVQIYLGDGAKKYYDIDVMLMHPFTDISGLGDEAHEENYAIFVRVGQLWIAITVIDHKTEAENRAGLETLAHKVVPLISS